LNLRKRGKGEEIKVKRARWWGKGLGWKRKNKENF